MRLQTREGENDVKYEIMREHRTRFKPCRGKTDASNNEPYGIGQAHAPGDNRNENSDAKEADSVGKIINPSISICTL